MSGGKAFNPSLENALTSDRCAHRYTRVDEVVWLKTNQVEFSKPSQLLLPLLINLPHSSNE